MIDLPLAVAAFQLPMLALASLLLARYKTYHHGSVLDTACVRLRLGGAERARVTRGAQVAAAEVLAAPALEGAADVGAGSEVDWVGEGEEGCGDEEGEEGELHVGWFGLVECCRVVVRVVVCMKWFEAWMRDRLGSEARTLLYTTDGGLRCLCWNHTALTGLHCLLGDAVCCTNCSDVWLSAQERLPSCDPVLPA
jgi:hypothetical protein